MGIFGGGKKPEPPKESFGNVRAGGGAGKKPDFSNVRAGGSTTATPGGPAAQVPVSTRAYTVAKGDSLWKIAKAHYGNGNKWRKIYEANRATIGDNPDIIHPGQTLTIPDPD
jgi:nucleoid-associated protein YgaU